MSDSLAVIFPGQGSQQVGMLAELGENFAVVQDTFAQASEVLGYDLWQLIQQGPDETLRQTERTQPALLTASVAVWRLLQQELQIDPSVVAGHSLGEYSALVCAGVLDFSAAVKLVQQRGQFMQKAVPSGVGAMAAILGLDDAGVEAACALAAEDQVVAAVNYNSPGQCVIAGNKEAVARAITATKEAGAKKAMILAVSAPFHCALMQPAADAMRPLLEATVFNTANCQVVQNVTGKICSDSQQMRENLITQIASPVRWVDCVNSIKALGADRLLECGPGRILSGMNKRIDRSITSMGVNDLVSLAKTKETLG